MGGNHLVDRSLIRRLVRRVSPFTIGGLLVIQTLPACSDDPSQPPDDGPGPIVQPIDGLPRWSPDSAHILYYHYGVVSFHNGDAVVDPQFEGLWVVRSDGISPRQLLRGSSIYGDWNATSDTLLYEYGGQIYRAAFADSMIDSLSVRQLTTNGGNFFPAWSPDGRWIAYDSNVGSTGPFEIWIMRSDGSEKRRIDRTGMGEWRMPSWSPAGSICHIRYPGGGTDFSEVFTMTDDGGNAARVTTNDREEELPRYSPDGTKLVFHSISAGDIAIWIANADGTGATRLAAGRDPCWSQDGQWIAFVRFGGDPRQNETIWKVRTNGTGLTQITFGPE